MFQIRHSENGWFFGIQFNEALANYTGMYVCILCPDFHGLVISGYPTQSQLKVFPPCRSLLGTRVYFMVSCSQFRKAGIMKGYETNERAPFRFFHTAMHSLKIYGMNCT